MRKMPNDVERLDRISSAMDADEKGNVTAGKDVKVDGKLKLTSLVSSTNLDGDITKELGGGGSPSQLFVHFITFTNSTDDIYIQYLSSKSDKYTKTEFISDISNKKLLATGYINNQYNVIQVEEYLRNVYAKYLKNPGTADAKLSSVVINDYTFTDEPKPVN